MGYRATLEAQSETVQDLVLSAKRRLDEATELYLVNKHHAAIYLAGLSAEMYLKTACFLLGRARLADPVTVLLAQFRPGRNRPPFSADYESGHGLSFWSEALQQRRRMLHLPPVPDLLHVSASLSLNWFVGMRYRPGAATEDEAALFITQVEWLAANHANLRR